MDVIWQALGHFFGLDNLSGPQYGFWSGVGSDITEVVLIGAIITALRHRNCHVKGCWRLQWRAVPGTDHVVCRRHHPHPAPTHEQVMADHEAAINPRAARWRS